MEKRKVSKTVITIAANVLMFVFIAICMLGVTLTLTAKREADGTMTIFGVQMRLVLSPSMEKCDETYNKIKKYDIEDIPTNSMIFIETVPEDEKKAEKWYDELEVGDVLTFKYVYNARQETITHRITAKNPDGKGGYIIELQGDNRSSESGVLTQTIYTSDETSTNFNYVVGKVTGQSYPLGLFVSALRSSWGLVFIIILPASIIVILEVIKIVRAVSADKRKKQLKEIEEQKSELDELRRRLAELEARNTGDNSK